MYTRADLRADRRTAIIYTCLACIVALATVALSDAVLSAIVGERGLTVMTYDAFAASW